MTSDKPAFEPVENPNALALRALGQTRQLLDTLITSSESFDYPKARQALKELDRMRRELGRAEARLRSASPPAELPKILPFPPARPEN